MFCSYDWVVLSLFFFARLALFVFGEGIIRWRRGKGAGSESESVWCGRLVLVALAVCGFVITLFAGITQSSSMLYSGSSCCCGLVSVCVCLRGVDVSVFHGSEVIFVGRIAFSSSASEFGWSRCSIVISELSSVDVCCAVVSFSGVVSSSFVVSVWRLALSGQWKEIWPNWLQMRHSMCGQYFLELAISLQLLQMRSLLLWMIRHHSPPICKEYGIEGVVKVIP